MVSILFNLTKMFVILRGCVVIRFYSDLPQLIIHIQSPIELQAGEFGMKLTVSSDNNTNGLLIHFAVIQHILISSWSAGLFSC
jgi:hypothetical protein